MSPQRPDPETLLARVKEEEAARAHGGQLKLFFGAAAGVGKTYAMLEAAREQRADGVDVVVGYVETHRRPETDALVAGLEVLPRRAVEYRGTTLYEFDLDAALARRPALALVDELAHTNAPGSRHAKRWQDVVTHPQLLREVWGPGHDEQAHYVRVAMAHLRHKLEAEPARPRYLLTEPGVGYRLAAE